MNSFVSDDNLLCFQLKDVVQISNPLHDKEAWQAPHAVLTEVTEDNTPDLSHEQVTRIMNNTRDLVENDIISIANHHSTNGRTYRHLNITLADITAREMQNSSDLAPTLNVFAYLQDPKTIKSLSSRVAIDESLEFTTKLKEAVTKQLRGRKHYCD